MDIVVDDSSSDRKAAQSVFVTMFAKSSLVTTVVCRNFMMSSLVLPDDGAAAGCVEDAGVPGSGGFIPAAVGLLAAAPAARSSNFGLRDLSAAARTCVALSALAPSTQDDGTADQCLPC